MTVPADLEIARPATLAPIEEIARSMGIPPDLLEPYGAEKGQIVGLS